MTTVVFCRLSSREVLRESPHGPATPTIVEYLYLMQACHVKNEARKASPSPGLRPISRRAAPVRRQPVPVLETVVGAASKPLS